MGHLYNCFNKEYDIVLEAVGSGTVCEENFEGSLGRIFESFETSCSRKPKDISLSIQNVSSDIFTAADTACLERLTVLKELILPDSITDITMSDKLLDILHGNSVLIRGSLGSFAERFADEYKLNFRPADFPFAFKRMEKYHESTSLSIIFRRSGGAAVEEDVNTTGSAAGNTFGGKFYKELPCDFWNSHTAEQIAEMYSAYLTEEILSDGRLAKFIAEAKNHPNIFTGEN